jgi:hypothetical protein
MNQTTLLASAFLAAKTAASPEAVLAKKAHNLCKGGARSKLAKLLKDALGTEPYYVSENRNDVLLTGDLFFRFPSQEVPLKALHAAMSKIGAEQVASLYDDPGLDLDHIQYAIPSGAELGYLDLKFRAPGAKSGLILGGGILGSPQAGVLPDGAAWEFLPDGKGGGNFGFYLYSWHTPAVIHVKKDPALAEALVGVCRTGRSLSNVLEFAARTGLRAVSRRQNPVTAVAVAGLNDLYSSVHQPARAEFAVRAFEKAGVQGLRDRLIKTAVFPDLTADGFSLEIVGSPPGKVSWSQVGQPDSLTVLDHPFLSLKDWMDFADKVAPKIHNGVVTYVQAAVDARLLKETR